MVGPSRRAIATRHASTVSAASAGRRTTRLGMARSMARCSTGWWVGPSSPDADRVVGADVDHRQPHDGRQADRRLHVVGEDQEGAPEGPEAAVRRDAVEDRRHAVLPHAPMELPARRRRAEGSALLQRGAGAAAEVGRSADQVGHRGGDGLERQAGGLPGGERPAARGERRQRAIPPLGQLARHPALELRGQIGVLGGVGAASVASHSDSARRAAVQRRPPVGQRVLRHEERPAPPASP